MKLSLFRIFLIVILLFAVFFVVKLRENIYSKDVLKLEILAPREIVVGKEVEFVVKYKNNGNFRLEEPELIFEPPENSLKENIILKREIITSKKIGEAIYPGEENSLSFKLFVFGREGETKIAKATMSFRPKGLKARYSVSTSFVSQIKSVPLTFEFDLPSKVEVGRNINVKLDYFSNLETLLTNLRVQVDYPSGFEFISSIPKSLDQTEWEIPLLNKTDGGRIEIQGKVWGEIGGVEIFKSRIGVVRDNKFIVLKEIEKGVEIIKPSIVLRQEINNNPNYVASPGEWLRYTIYFKNVGEEEMKNLFLISKLEGDAFDLRTLRSDLGDYKPGDNSVIFDWRRISKLQYLAPMDEGKVEFWVRLKDDIGDVVTPVIKNKVFISQIKEEFITKISSKIEVVQQGFYHDEIFGNSGPLPPKVGATTTYTILWKVKNYYAKVNDVKVKAKLPSYVNLTGNIFPEEMSSKFSFDSNSREIVWSVGELEKRKSNLTDTEYVIIAFQVVFSPLEEHIGNAPEIIGEVKATGEDSWTGRIIEATFSPITTILLNDPEMTPFMGIVE